MFSLLSKSIDNMLNSRGRKSLNSNYWEKNPLMKTSNADNISSPLLNWKFAGTLISVKKAVIYYKCTNIYIIR